jgi:serine 3-dehydrogenase
MSNFTKRVLITGASSGIGQGCARRFAGAGATLILWARRLDRLQRIADELEARHARHVHVAAVDVRSRDEVFAAAQALHDANAIPDVLINNAGLASGFDNVQDGAVDDWEQMIDTNVKGLLYVSRAVLPHMIARGSGHIINIGSMASHQTYPKGNVYSATKHAVLALTEGMNLDLAGTPIRVSSVDPGLVETEFSTVRFHGDSARAKKVYEGMRPLTGDDVADTIFYVASLPAHINILDLIIVPTAQRNAYVVHRE